MTVGHFNFINTDDNKNLIVYERHNAKQRFVIVVNNSDTQVTFQPQWDKTVDEHILNGDHLTSKKRDMHMEDTIDLKPYDFKVFAVMDS